MKRSTSVATIEAEPSPLAIDHRKTALLIIDMQRDFLEPGGFGAALGNDITRLDRQRFAPCRDVLHAARRAGILVIHTREGHRADLSDVPPLKVERGDPALRIGAPGPMGRILVRGEPGHDIIPELYPVAGELVIDKPGEGARPPRPISNCSCTTGASASAPGLRRHDRGLRQHHGARGQRSRLPMRRALRLLRILFRRISRGGTGNDQGPGRHFRLGLVVKVAAQFVGSIELSCPLSKRGDVTEDFRGRQVWAPAVLASVTDR